MASRPAVIPEAFTGEGEWTQWIYHFENIAAVNEWNDAKKLLWLKARLTGRAQLAFQHASTEIQEDYDRLKQAMKDRFEPESRKGRYQAEFQTRRKKPSEGWADFAQDLQSLADKAFPHLQGEARDQLALTHYLSQIDNAQLAFSVKQQKPTNLDAAVSATLEMESYLPSKSAILGIAGTDVKSLTEQTSLTAAATATGTDSTTELMKQLLDRMDKMEVELRQSKQAQLTAEGRGSRKRVNPNYRRKPPVICWNCNQPGHVARNCRVYPPQGNANPYTD